jgi:hypothetical protein
MAWSFAASGQRVFLTWQGAWAVEEPSWSGCTLGEGVRLRVRGRITTQTDIRGVTFQTIDVSDVETI